MWKTSGEHETGARRDRYLAYILMVSQEYFHFQRLKIGRQAHFVRLATTFTKAIAIEGLLLSPLGRAVSAAEQAQKCCDGLPPSLDRSERSKNENMESIECCR
eukprot:s11_g29.t1